MKKSTMDDLRDYLISCIDKEGIIRGKQHFSLQLGMLENALFKDVEEIFSSIYHFSEYSGSSNPEDANLEELPVVDDYGNIIPKLGAVS